LFFGFAIAVFEENSSLKLKYVSFEMWTVEKKLTKKYASKTFWRKVAWGTWCMGSYDIF